MVKESAPPQASSKWLEKDAVKQETCSHDRAIRTAICTQSIGSKKGFVFDWQTRGITVSILVGTCAAVTALSKEAWNKVSSAGPDPMLQV